MKLQHWLLSAAVILSAVGFAQERRKIEYVEYDLDNGIHVILHEDHTTPIVAVTMMYKVGSKNENPNRTGFAHFFEHLMFEGTENIDRHEYDKYVERAGGTLNANTSHDRTFYYELLPSNQLELGLWLESERLLHAKVDNVGIETQREVVKEEKRQRMDNQPYGSFMYEVFRRAYNEHPYQWIPIGSMEHLDAAQEEDYVNFYRTFYVPHNVTLSIAGDIDIAQTKKWIDAYFASIPNGEKLNIYRDKEFLDFSSFMDKYGTYVGPQATASEFGEDYHGKISTEAFIKKYFAKASSKPIEVPRPSVNEGLLKKEVRDTIYDNIQLPAVMMAYRTPELMHKDKHAVELLTMILADGNSSRLVKNVVDDQQLALGAYSFPFQLEDPGLAINFAIANMGVDPGELEAAIEKEVEKLQAELITDREMEKLRNMIESRFVSSYSTMAGIAEALADYHVYENNTELINTELDKYLAVTKEDIQHVAKTYFTKENRVVLYYLPNKGE